MDTSDSEYFESADEDVQSDVDEKTNAKAPAKHENPVKKKDTPLTKSNAKELSDKDENLQNDVDHSNSNKTEESTVHLISEVQNLNIEHQSSTSHKQEIEKIDHMNVKTEPSKTTEEHINEKTKNSKVNPKFKLGNKAVTKIEQFDAPPDEKVQESVDKPEITNEIKKKDEKTKISKVNPKFKLGNQAVTKIEQFDEKVQESVDKSEITNEIKKTDDKTESAQVEEENLWDDDELDWEAEAQADNNIISHQSPLDKDTNKRINKETVESDSWSSWSNWGVSVLSSATQSVSSITNQISNVIESGIGAVDPEELARIEKEEKKTIKEDLSDGNMKHENTESYGFGLGNLVKLVENTGTKVISGGLDTLETIGKKTMEVLQEGDPGLKKKRAFLKIDQDKPVLSQILREAKEKAENEMKTSEQTSKRKCKNYETLFDDHHGLVHLEALELLSKQCEIKLKNIQSTMTGEEFTDFTETMDQIKELCELPDEDDEEQITVEEIKEKLDKAVSEMGLQINYEKLVSNWQETEIWLSTIDLDVRDEKELHQQAIETLAEMTSRAMEQFHKTGELLLIKDRRSTADEADSLVQITATLISLIGIVAAKFCEKLNGKLANNKEVSALITNVFFEAANSSSYIQDALQLLIPVLQVGAI